jgi:hypothetical protein
MFFQRWLMPLLFLLLTLLQLGALADRLAGWQLGALVLGGVAVALVIGFVHWLCAGARP